MYVVCLKPVKERSEIVSSVY